MLVRVVRESNNSKMLPQNWSKYIKDLARVDRELESKRVIFVGATPYTRIAPAFFMKNYEIFCLKDCLEIRDLRKYTNIYCLEQEQPAEIDKIKSTTEIIQHPAFLNYLKKYRRRYSLLFYMMGGVLHKKLKENKLPYLANHPLIARDVLYKASFRQILKDLHLPTLPDKLMSKEEFLAVDYQTLTKEFGPSFVCQRGDYDTGGQRGTFFVHQAKDLKMVKGNYQKEANFTPHHFEGLSQTSTFKKSGAGFTKVQISKFIKGNSLSMLGCVTQSGILTSCLQTQLIDVPEVLDGEQVLGQFLGHDWGNKDYSEAAVNLAEKIVITMGEYLAKKNFKGIFGIDMMYDPQEPDMIYPIECNPRFTGAFPMVSLLMLEKGLPPFDLFHILEHRRIKYEVNVPALNKLYKEVLPQSNIYIGGQKVVRMPVAMKQGIYGFNESGDIKYLRPGVFPWHLKSEFEFLAIDNVFRKDYPLMQDVSRLFRLIFPMRISKTSNELLPLFSHIVKSFTHLINHSQ